jgi:hypothetical protein
MRTSGYHRTDRYELGRFRSASPTSASVSQAVGMGRHSSALDPRRFDGETRDQSEDSLLTTTWLLLIPPPSSVGTRTYKPLQQRTRLDTSRPLQLSSSSHMSAHRSDHNPPGDTGPPHHNPAFGPTANFISVLELFRAQRDRTDPSSSTPPLTFSRCTTYLRLNH